MEMEKENPSTVKLRKRRFNDGLILVDGELPKNDEICGNSQIVNVRNKALKKHNHKQDKRNFLEWVNHNNSIISRFYEILMIILEMYNIELIKSIDYEDFLIFAYSHRGVLQEDLRPLTF